ncbi:protein SUPPRESSOR OF npr1-1, CONSTITUTIVE 1-like [Cajanus cajan]|nr:protein SUPPRESSOR OF npr1-1, CONSTITUTIVE 1-like [Cajanus cajan]
MKLSFDDLDRKEKQIFLDLACFFLKLSTKINVDNLKSLLKDDKSDNSVIFGLERLKDKALISFSEDNIVSMHDSLQEMACEIVRQESIEDSGSRSRLWDPNDIYEVLKNDKVTEAIRSIRIQLTTIRGLKLRPHIFAKMSKLKFLEISREDAYYGFENQLGEGPLFLATELRFLSWDCYPLKSLPQNFSAEKLVILKLQLSKLEKLWDGVKNLVSLKGVYLDGSSELKELPDLSKAINLEVLDLSSCESLTTVHPSIFSLAKLEILNLSNCISLTILSSDSHMHSLNYLILDYCKSLTEFSIISKNMEELDLSWTEKMKALPSSFGHQRKLKSLDLTGSGIQRLPSSINNLTQLLHLNLSYCRELETIPELPLSLKNINARDCKSLKTILLLPSTSVEQLRANRTRVLLWNCLNLDQHSLVAIELNAQISVMNFANQHLSVEHSPVAIGLNTQGNVMNFTDHNKVVYVYPGSCVPEWLEYKTTNNYVIIDLSSTPSSPMLNFIFCFVLSKYEGTARKNELTVKITLSDGDGEGERDSVEMFMDDWFFSWTIESNHVCDVRSKMF